MKTTFPDATGTAADATALDPAYIQSWMQRSPRSCRLQVLDPIADVLAWQDIRVVVNENEDEGGHDAYFWLPESAQPSVFLDMVDAFEELTRLLEAFRPLRLAIVLNAPGQRVYDSASKADVRHLPEFYVMPEQEWVEVFALCLATELPAQTANAHVIGRQLYAQHRHEHPGAVAVSLRSDADLVRPPNPAMQTWHLHAAVPYGYAGEDRLVP
jgi:hypothetical protein